MSKRHEQIRPRNGHTLVVCVVARISGGPNQKELSLDDQVDHAKHVVAELYDGPVEYRVVATTGKGERRDRPELAEVEAMICSGEIDLLVAEDLGRIIRGTDASDLCGTAVDHGVRVIAPNDAIDTAEDTWEEDVISACRDHVGHNSHTSKRLKQKLMNRFVLGRGAAARPIFGYIVPPGSKKYDDWRKDDAATPIYREWFARLRRDLSGALVADWLNRTSVPTGPYARSKVWTGRMVLRVTRNPLLKGMPGRGFRRTVKHHKSGRRVSMKSPDRPKFYSCPELAHVPPEEFDELNALLKEHNAGMGRKSQNGRDPRAGVMRSRTVWPGQHVVCGVCGRLMYWGGHGQKEHMMCSGTRDYTCWNTATFDGVAAGTKLLNAFLQAIETVPDYDADFLAALRDLSAETMGGRAERLHAAEQAVARCDRQERNVADAIGDMGYGPILEEKYRQAQAESRKARAIRDAILREPCEVPDLPPVAELKRVAREVTDLGFDDPDFGRQMRLLVPRIAVLPYRPHDGGRVVLRAALDIDLSPLAGKAESFLASKLRRTVVVDLFDPPQRVAFMEDVVRLRGEGRSEAEVAAELGLTVTAAQDAAALARLTAAAGSTDPYVWVAEPPADNGRMTRHRHERYVFRPLDGYPLAPLSN